MLLAPSAVAEACSAPACWAEGAVASARTAATANTARTTNLRMLPLHTHRVNFGGAVYYAPIFGLLSALSAIHTCAVTTPAPMIHTEKPRGAAAGSASGG